MPYAYQQGNYAAGDNYGRSGHYSYQAGGIFSSIGKFVGGILKKTPLGGVVSGVVSGLTSRALAPAGVSPLVPMISPGVQIGRPISNVPTQYPEQTALLRQPGYERPDVTGGCMVKGRRLNKSTYVTRGGGTSPWPEQIIVHPKGTECVKSRRMNVTNVRALRRSIRRATGFAKLARRVLSFVDAKAPKGRARFKRKR